MELKDLFIGKIVKDMGTGIPVVVREICFNATGEVIVIVSYPSRENTGIVLPDIVKMNSSLNWLYTQKDIDISRVPIHPTHLTEM